MLTCLSSQAVSQQNCKLRIVKPQVNVKTKQKNVGAKITSWKIQQKNCNLLFWISLQYRQNLKSQYVWFYMSSSTSSNFWQKPLSKADQRNDKKEYFLLVLSSRKQAKPHSGIQGEVIAHESWVYIIYCLRSRPGSPNVTCPSFCLFVRRKIEKEWPSNWVTEWQSDRVTEWPSKQMTGWQAGVVLVLHFKKSTS